jgi:hypothetical protein
VDCVTIVHEIARAFETSTKASSSSFATFNASLEPLLQLSLSLELTTTLSYNLTMETLSLATLSKEHLMNSSRCQCGESSTFNT